MSHGKDFALFPGSPAAHSTDFQREGALQQRNVQVLALEAGRVRLLSRRPREEWEMPLTDVLGADYARGDEGQGEG